MNVENWTYKSKAEVEALDNKTLVDAYKDLCTAIKNFSNAHLPWTDEMFWQFVVINNILSARKLNKEVIEK